jgi:hypothetical protein
MILAIASTQFPQTFDSHGQDSSRPSNATATLTTEIADTVQISSQARAAQASYRRVSENNKLSATINSPAA